jgi:hypothetical protein
MATVGRVWAARSFPEPTERDKTARITPFRSAEANDVSQGRCGRGESTGAIRSVLSHRAPGFSLLRALPERFSLVMELLAAGERESDFESAAAKVEIEGNQGKTLLLNLADEPSNLLRVEEELPRSLGILVPTPRRIVWRDVERVKPDFPALNPGEGVLEGNLPLPERLYLRTYQNHPGLPAIEDRILVTSLSVRSDDPLPTCVF